MDTPAAAPNQLVSSSESDLVPQAASTVPWITFGGSPSESTSAFVQSVQRIGFQQGRGRDDGWMAEYAATCFEGDALIWYSELDDEVQESWKKLRTNLLRKFPHVAGGGGLPIFPAHQAAVIPSAPVSAGALPTDTRYLRGIIGKIELLRKHTASAGYLSFDPTSGIETTTDKDKAIVLCLPRARDSDVFQMEMVNIPGRSLPYAGLALLVTQGQDQFVVPDILHGYSSRRLYGGLVHWNGVPEPSSICKHAVPADSTNARYSKVAFATWTFSACGESEKLALYRRRSQTNVSGRRAAAAVWKYNEDTEELTMYWLMDNDTECEVGGYVHNGSSDQLHVHRVSDMDKTGDYIKEERVRFIFRRTQ